MQVLLQVMTAAFVTAYRRALDGDDGRFAHPDQVRDRLEQRARGDGERVGVILVPALGAKGGEEAHCS